MINLAIAARDITLPCSAEFLRHRASEDSTLYQGKETKMVIANLLGTASCALITAGLFATLAPSNPCTDSGYSATTLRLICNGECDDGTACDIVVVTDGHGYTLYEYCGCELGDEPVCCHLVGYTWPVLYGATGECEDQDSDCPPGTNCKMTGTFGTAKAVCEQEGGG